MSTRARQSQYISGSWNFIRSVSAIQNILSPPRPWAARSNLYTLTESIPDTLCWEIVCALLVGRLFVRLLVLWKVFRIGVLWLRCLRIWFGDFIVSGLLSDSGVFRNVFGVFLLILLSIKEKERRRSGWCDITRWRAKRYMGGVACAMCCLGFDFDWD